jgi:hypothetical protein
LSQTSKYLSSVFVSNGNVYSKALVVFGFEDHLYFLLIQNSFHSEWAFKYGSSLSNTLHYTPSDCFLTFPFPRYLAKSMEKSLEKIGEKYHEHRRKLMLKMKLGLTKTYNLFHDKNHMVEKVKK